MLTIITKHGVALLILAKIGLMVKNIAMDKEDHLITDKVANLLTS